MKKTFLFLAVLCALCLSCEKNSEGPDLEGIDFRAEMRRFVQAISAQARGLVPDFLVIPQNGQVLITENGEPAGAVEALYAAAINGTGREDLFYGYTADDAATPAAERNEMTALCDVFEANGIEVLAIDYCSSHAKMDDSYAKNAARGYISFAAPDRDLRVIPDYPAAPHGCSTDDVLSLSQAKNFLYLINPENFSGKQAFLTALAATDYDLIIMDAFFGDTLLTAADIGPLKTKHGGGRRIVVAYMSIGEAEDYRYYWKENWSENPPDWLGDENPDWPGNYKVYYWDASWQAVICGAGDSYLQRILAAGFDGVYLDLIDAYEYFEEM